MQFNLVLKAVWAASGAVAALAGLLAALTTLLWGVQVELCLNGLFGRCT